MEKKVKKVTTIIAAIFCMTFLAPEILAQDNDNEANTQTDQTDNSSETTSDALLEEDNQDRVNEKDFSETFTTYHLYDTWDFNNDSYLDENEFYDGYYSVWDVDSNSVIDRNEWDTRVQRYKTTDNNAVTTWETWDLDNNNEISKSEFRTGYNQVNDYKNLDKDKNEKVDENEFLGGLFSDFDLNKDGFLDKDEYDDNFFDIDLKKDTKLK